MANRISVSVTGYQEVLRGLNAGLAERAARAALKRTMERTRTKLTQSISGGRGRYTIPANQVRDKMAVRVPGGGYEGVLAISGERLNVTRFKHRQTAAGLVVEILRGTKRLIKSVFLPRKKGAPPTTFSGQPLAFIRKKTDRPNPFHQTPDSRTSTGVDAHGQKRRFRFPLAVVRSLSIPKMVSTEKFHDRQYIAEFMGSRFLYEFRQAIIGISALKGRGQMKEPT